ncbi:MAG TPA: two-component regulator propeller domain-containing protein, partial [Armatimonadota bacterium]|nr:two-component regulator propeller domain-containing protein [Armatimonadota bacterium]
MPVPLPPATLRVGPFAQRRSDRYTVQHGLPPGRALAVSVSGSDVCVRTEAGASEYTQGRWTSVEDERAHSASHSLVPGGALPAGEKLLSAAEGAGGRVWLVTDRGAYCWSRDECLPVIPPATAPANQPPVPAQPQLTCVAVDTNGTVWFGSTAGVFATDGAGWWNVIDRGSGLPYEDVTCIALAPGGELWVGTTEGV